MSEAKKIAEQFADALGVRDDVGNPIVIQDVEISRSECVGVFSQLLAPLMEERAQLRAEIERLRGQVNRMAATLYGIRDNSIDPLASHKANEALTDGGIAEGSKDEK
jgi:hypothetical protein